MDRPGNEQRLRGSKTWKRLFQPVAGGLARLANLLARYHQVRYQKSRKTEYLERSIVLYRDTVRLRPPGHPDRPSSLGDLANALYSRYEGLGKMGDLEECISLYRDALCLRPHGNPGRPSSLHNLATVLSSHYEVLGKVEDLEECILLHREALCLYPHGHPNRPNSLNNLAVGLLHRYNMLGKVEDLEESILLHRETLSLRPHGHPNRPRSLNNLANCLSSRYKVLGKIEDLEESILLHIEALSLRPPSHPNRPNSLNNLAIGLSSRYEVLGKMEDLEESILLHRETLSLRPHGHPDRSVSLNNLANRLSSHYKLLGKIEHLEESILLHREALCLRPHGHPDHSVSLNNLATVLSSHYEALGKVEDLEESILLHSEALSLRPHGHPNRPNSLNNLANCLSSHYKVLGKMEDLEESILLHRETLSLRAHGHPDRSVSLNTLAVVLSDRYDVLGKMEDLEESILLHSEALSLRPHGHPNRPNSLNNIANCLSSRCKVLGKMEDLEESISLHREALCLRPHGHPKHPNSLNNLAVGLLYRYNVLGKIEDLEESILLHREALCLRPHGHPDRSMSLNSLAKCLSSRYEVLEKMADLEEGISLHRDALCLRPLGNFYHSDSLTNLARTLCTRYKQFRNEEDLQEIFSLYERTAHDAVSSVQHRLHVAIQWADSGRKFQHNSLLSAYKLSFPLISRCMVYLSSVESQQKFLASARIPRSLASDAASAAIEAGNFELAVEFLEQGRSILWSKVDAYKQPLDQLCEVTGGRELANRLEAIGAELEHIVLSSSRPSQLDKEGFMGAAFVEAQMKQHRILSEEWDNLVSKIRNIDGFSYFLQSPPFSTLQSAAADGPVVLVNVSKFRSDAIIILKNCPPVLVNLPEVRHIDLCAQKLGSPREIMSTLRYLWDTIASPVVDRLTELGIPKKSRIWWCPTAELCAFPLHAAARGKRNLQDIYTSSYTLTLSSLIRARSNIVQPSTIPKLLLVGQPSETLKLEQVEVEVELVKGLGPGNSVDVLFGPEASCEAVLDGLRQHSWVHFACHGHLGKDSQPFQASFELHDGHQTRHLPLLDIIQTRLPNAELAFLSACHSAAGDSSTPDESIHLSAALQFCGFRSVVGTLWEMDDEDGPTISEEFYKYMFRNPDKIDFRDSAYALSKAIKAMRKAKVPLERWVMFVHIGA